MSFKHHHLARHLALIGLIVIAVIVLSLAQIFRSPEGKLVKIIANPNNKQQMVKLRGINLQISFARTPAERELGLSGRQSLGQFEGLLFAFPYDQKPAFWMKGMNFPIDIIWLDRQFKVVDLTRQASPNSYPQQFIPNKPVRYVLEVSAGLVDDFNIRVGDYLTI